MCVVGRQRQLLGPRTPPPRMEAPPPQPNPSHTKPCPPPAREAGDLTGLFPPLAFIEKSVYNWMNHTGGDSRGLVLPRPGHSGFTPQGLLGLRPPASWGRLSREAPPSPQPGGHSLFPGVGGGAWTSCKGPRATAFLKSAASGPTKRSTQKRLRPSGSDLKPALPSALRCVLKALFPTPRPGPFACHANEGRPGGLWLCFRGPKNSLP